MCGWPVPEDLHTVSWKGTVALTRKRRSVADHRVFVIGDAASYVEPFTGEGIAWALESAACLAPLVVKGARCWDPSLIWHWQHIYRRTVGRRQRPTRYVAAVLRNAPAAMAASNLLHAVPGLIRPLMNAVNGGRAREDCYGCDH
jgi:flavin-dependent dehydrogenase